MSNLDNLVKKIVNDCEIKSKDLINSANTKAAEIMQFNTQEAEKESARILADARIEAEKAADQIITSRKLTIRDENLNAKRETINRVFDSALKKLNSLPKQDYLKFLRSGLAASGIKDGELILPAAYNISDISGINKDLSSSFTLHSNGRNISGGFVLITEGIERNYTFEALIQYYRDELESEIIDELF